MIHSKKTRYIKIEFLKYVQVIHREAGERKQKTKIAVLVTCKWSNCTK